MDTTGRTPLEDETSIVMEKVRGRGEELYWDKILENVQGQAVDKAIKAKLASGAESSASMSDTTYCNNDGSGSGQKKSDKSMLKIHANSLRDAHFDCKPYAKTKMHDRVVY